VDRCPRRHPLRVGPEHALPLLTDSVLSLLFEL
jgi:hypothetical protein